MSPTVGVGLPPAERDSVVIRLNLWFSNNPPNGPPLDLDYRFKEPL